MGHCLPIFTSANFPERLEGISCKRNKREYEQFKIQSSSHEDRHIMGVQPRCSIVLQEKIAANKLNASTHEDDTIVANFQTVIRASGA